MAALAHADVHVLTARRLLTRIYAVVRRPVAVRLRGQLAAGTDHGCHAGREEEEGAL